MKKTLLAITLLASFGIVHSAMAAPGDDLPTGGTTLQWAGSVPAETVSGAGYWIVQDGGIAFTEGVLTFKNDATGIALNSASEIGFKVVSDEEVNSSPYDPSTDVNPINYKYTLTNIKVGINGFSAEQQAPNGYFTVHANGGDALVIGTEKSMTDKGATRLTLKSSNSTAVAENLKSGDDVVVMAVVSVTPQEL